MQALNDEVRARRVNYLGASDIPGEVIHIPAKIIHTIL